MKTYMARPGQIKPKWYVVDATDCVVGRLARDIAMILMGKHRPTYTPYALTGDCVVVTNCEKVVFTGKKMTQKQYTWYTGYTRQRSETPADRMKNSPEEILIEAVRRMLPKNKLARRMLERLKVCVGPEHPYQSQQPEAVVLGIKNQAKVI